VTDLAKQIAGSPSLRVRQGQVVSVSSYGVTVTIAGSTTEIPGVKYLGSYVPQPGAHVWLLTDGDDMFAIGHLAPFGVPALQVSRSSVQTLTTAVEAAVSFDGETGTDPWGMWVVGSPTRMTVPVDGWYSFTGYAQFVANVTNVRSLKILQGGATVLAFDRRLAANSLTTDITVTTGPVSMSAGAYVELWAYQNSGGNLDVAAGCVLRGHYVGPAQ
jgi:hypothetical protein